MSTQLTDEFKGAYREHERTEGEYNAALNAQWRMEERHRAERAEINKRLSAVHKAHRKSQAALRRAMLGSGLIDPATGLYVHSMRELAKMVEEGASV
jgi:hypothetical protein